MLNKKNATRVGWIFTILLFMVIVPLLSGDFPIKNDPNGKNSYAVGTMISTFLGFILTQIMKFDIEKHFKPHQVGRSIGFMIICFLVPFMAGYTLYLILVDKNELNEDDDLLENRMDK